MTKSDYLSTQITKDGITLDVDVYHDDYPGNPRKEWDNLGTMACAHRRYNLGDEQHKDPDEFLKDLAREYEGEKVDRLQERFDDAPINHPWGSTEWCKVAAQMEREFMSKVMAIVHKHYVILPLYLYDHSGITMSTSRFSCSWDSGQVGYIYADRKRILKEYNAKILTKKLREKVELILESEVEVYDNYLTGAVYYYEVKFPSVDDEDEPNEIDATLAGQEIDSCGGYYGEKDIEDHIKESTDWWIERAKKMRRDAEYNLSLSHAGMVL